MSTRIGIKAFRDNFTSIARDAKGPVIVTNHDRVVGYYTPAKREPPDKEWFDAFDHAARKARAGAESRGVNVAARLKELGIEDDKPFDDPWTEGNPGKPAPEFEA